MEKEKLIKEAVDIWCSYGNAINTAFGFQNFYIDGEPLNKVLNTNSETEISKFIQYVKERITELEEAE